MPEMKKTKYCPCCKQVKPVLAFYSNKSQYDGWAPWCKICMIEYSKTPGRRAYQKKYREEHHEQVCASMRRWTATPQGKYSHLKTSAQRRNIPFELLLDDFCAWLSTQEDRCHYCGGQLVDDNSLSAYTIDRKDNSQSYNPDNIVLACRRCNTSKGSWFTEEQMLEIAGKYLRRRH